MYEHEHIKRQSSGTIQFSKQSLVHVIYRLVSITKLFFTLSHSLSQMKKKRNSLLIHVNGF